MKHDGKHIWMIILMSIFVVIGCSDEPEVDPIDAELLEYFDRFKVEGEMRGLEIDFEARGIHGQLINITDPGVVGKCLKYSDGSRAVIIEEFSWNKYTDMEKEFLVFHELGHCFLDREHLDTADSHGNCISIMHSSNNACFSNYYSFTRDEYLDELFK